jgi:hypothetical protein
VLAQLMAPAYLLNCCCWLQMGLPRDDVAAAVRAVAAAPAAATRWLATRVLPLPPATTEAWLPRVRLGQGAIAGYAWAHVEGEEKARKEARTQECIAKGDPPDNLGALPGAFSLCVLCIPGPHLPPSYASFTSPTNVLHRCLTLMAGTARRTGCSLKRRKG